MTLEIHYECFLEVSVVCAEILDVQYQKEETPRETPLKLLHIR